MNGREGDYPPDKGTHVTRVFSCDEYTWDAWAGFCQTCGIEPGKLLPSDGAVADGYRREGRVAVAGQWWPIAVMCCTCRVSRAAGSRIMARSAAFVHRELASLR